MKKCLISYITKPFNQKRIDYSMQIHEVYRIGETFNDLNHNVDIIECNSTKNQTMLSMIL